jgi:hypothetical protein
MPHNLSTPGAALASYLATHRQMNESSTEFLLTLTNAPVMLTAPHAKATIRDGEYKRRDNNVGVLAVVAARLAGVCALVPTTPGDQDGNWSPDSKFRNLLSSVAKDASVIDVHGMTDAHGLDLVIGTAGGGAPEWLVALAYAAATDAGWRVDVRHQGPLSASGMTITALANDELAGGIQLEIARRWRDGRNSPSEFSTAVDVVARIAAAAANHRQTAGE